MKLYVVGCDLTKGLSHGLVHEADCCMLCVVRERDARVKGDKNLITLPRTIFHYHFDPNCLTFSLIVITCVAVTL